MPTTVTLSTQGAVAIEREERRRCIPRGEGLSSDRPTFLRSPVKTFGRFSVRGPAAWRRMAVREKTVTRCTARVKPYPTICLSPLILSPLNGQVKMSPHEQGDILIESERVATSGGGFSMYQGGGGVCLSPRGGLLEGAPDKAPVETLAGKPGGGPGTPPSRPGPANPPSFD